LIKLSAIGDIALFGEYDNIIDKQGKEFPFSLVSNHFKKRDLVIGNLEVPLSNLGSPDKSKPISLRGAPEAINALKSSGITHVSMANNHSYDYGEEAALDTIENLMSAGISSFGIGKNLSHSRKPIIEEINGVRIALLAYNSYLTNGRRIAKSNSSGIAPLEYEYIKYDIDLIKQNDKDCKIIISFHWGEEMKSYPSPFQIDLARQLIEDGANIILGHHPHVIQGVEDYKEGVIIYSLGNFCFPKVESPHIDGIGYVQLPKNRESFIFDSTITQYGVEGYDFTPVIINDNLQPEIASGNTKSKILDRIRVLSQKVTEKDYNDFYKSENEKNGNEDNIIISIFKRLGFVGILKRINLMYLRAHLIAIMSSIKEYVHKRNFYSGFTN